MVFWMEQMEKKNTVIRWERYSCKGNFSMRLGLILEILQKSYTKQDITQQNFSTTPFLYPKLNNNDPCRENSQVR